MLPVTGVGFATQVVGQFERLCGTLVGGSSEHRVETRDSFRRFELARQSPDMQGVACRRS
jgi:hypothetical protein